ncbi:MAG: hypothetical protein EOP04_27790 [Proteobacteria bacterium]|nr:MAG: hypothetical protein EOP04_27790 [Pseudomonadota bacterium]
MSSPNLYQELHVLFNTLPRLSFPYVKIDDNGVYVMFQKGEKYKGMNRIVRIGSHTHPNRLKFRLNEHFVLHRRSVFRKHIGRCFLVKEKREDYLPIWNCNTITKEERAFNLPRIDWALEKGLEGRITSYLRENFSFVLIPGLTDTDKRCRLEKGLIATLAQSADRCYSKEWLGKWHFNQKIPKSCLWNVNHIGDKPLSQQELLELQGYLSQQIAAKTNRPPFS